MSPRSDRRASRPLGRGTGRVPRQRRDLRTIYVAAEGETEYDYLLYLGREYGGQRGFRILTPPMSTRRNGLQPDDMIDHARTKADADDIDEVWVVFDHDCRDNIPKIFARARSAGVQVAFSHPAFELWLLLHFRSFATPQSGRNTRVIEALRKADQEAFGHYGDRGKRISPARFAALARENGITKAVRNARSLDDNCPSGCCSGSDPTIDGHPADRCDPDKRDPSTGVWRLMEGLGITNTCCQKG